MAPELQTGFKIEQSPAPEHAPEKLDAAAAARQRAAEQPSPTAATTVPLPTRPVAPPTADPIQKEVETVLTENIAEIYKQLPQDRKTAFKQKGEEIAMQISAMIKGGLMQIKKILKMIREWLLIIPGVNKFFLEQEAKIKTDKIQALYEREHAAAL